MESASLVSLRPSLCILGLARAVLAKVFCRSRSHIGEQFHLDPTEWFSYNPTERKHERMVILNHENSSPTIKHGHDRAGGQIESRRLLCYTLKD